MKKILALVLVLLILCVSLAGCFGSKADRVNYNLTKKAEQFGCERRITVYNARTDTIILEAEGYMDISNNSADELVITVRVSEDEYKKNYIYLNEYILYVVEDITGTHTDPYHYELYFHTTFPVDVNIVE